MPSPGVVFRHQQNASMNGGAVDAGGKLGQFYGYKETFSDKNVWVDVPSKCEEACSQVVSAADLLHK